MRAAIISFTFLCLSCSYSEKHTNLIYGKWESISTKIISKGDTINTKKNTLQLIFFEDSIYWGFSGARGHETFKYSLEKNILIINGEKMELVELSESQLVYKRNVLVDDLYEIDTFKKSGSSEW